MKISVCITLYNSEQYYSKILNWINKFSSFFRFIIVDDGTKFFKQSVFYSLLKSRPNIKLINKEFNKGVSNSRNLAINSCFSDYLIFVDSDDDVDFNLLLNLIDEVSCDVVIFDYMNNFKLVKVNENLNFYSSPVFNPVWNKIYRLEFLKKNTIFFNEKLYVGEDLDFNLNVLKTANVKFFHSAFYFYNEEVNNSLSKGINNNVFSSYEILFNNFYNKLSFSLTLYRDLHLIITYNLWRKFTFQSQYKGRIIKLFAQKLNLKYCFGSLKLMENRFRIKFLYFFLFLKFSIFINHRYAKENK
jgi:glycosyltransferase involved in cell wall biosynthesis